MLLNVTVSLSQFWQFFYLIIFTSLITNAECQQTWYINSQSSPKTQNPPKANKNIHLLSNHFQLNARYSSDTSKENKENLEKNAQRIKKVLSMPLTQTSTKRIRKTQGHSAQDKDNEKEVTTTHLGNQEAGGWLVCLFVSYDCFEQLQGTW